LLPVKVQKLAKSTPSSALENSKVCTLCDFGHLQFSDCTAPFQVYIKTDALTDTGTAAAAAPNNRGMKEKLFEQNV
jgi:hypothetical protein